ncbi:MAG: site-2 protease family protein [Phenylobacterium sp.]|uniref:site-2 protease family protein n=1 Tax=Phenylobacterium sp. TaxID=1871053 RepID=UPI002A358978|nr:site-2 protease family protein [Phenylobacterium sp.]MDX9998493.1 site-2 protease family protein [Phenylobacterium sp.]
MLAGWLALGAVLALVRGAPGIVTFVFVVAGWMLALVAHEFGHAFVAWKAGDHTVAEKGYLTLDPIKYADLGTSLVIPLIALALGGIGFPGGAVYLREDLMRSPAWRSAASLAGPAGTLAMFVILSAAAQFWLGLYGADGIALSAALAFLAFLQATALILNLLPVPGLDGWGVIRPFLPQDVRERLGKVEAVAMVALLAAIFFVPGVSAVLIGAAVGLTEAAGVPGIAIAAGFEAFRFWD